MLFFRKSQLRDDSHFIFAIENGFMTKVLMERWKLTEFILAFFACVSIGLSILEVILLIFWL